MAVSSLIPELEQALQSGSAVKRADALRRITNLFLAGAPSYSDEHVEVFDQVLGRMIVEIEAKALAELSNRLAPVANAPIGVMNQLARNDDINVAGPVLQSSPQVKGDTLVEVAKTKSQAHLLAIAGRNGVDEHVTEVLVRRGDRDVARNVARNAKARLSESGFAALVKRAESDGDLAEQIGRRADIPPHLFRTMLMQATEVVQQRLLAGARPEIRNEIKRVLAKVSEEVRAQAPAPRDFSAAQRTILALRKAGKLNESELAKFAETKKYEEVVAALSALCAVPIDVIDRLIQGDRPDPVLILGKAAGFSWPTVRAIIAVRTGRDRDQRGLDNALANFERLAPATAQRVVRFWQLRPAEAS